jgi:hypothetical protein
MPAKTKEVKQEKSFIQKITEAHLFARTVVEELFGADQALWGSSSASVIDGCLNLCVDLDENFEFDEEDALDMVAYLKTRLGEARDFAKNVYQSETADDLVRALEALEMENEDD